MALTWYALTLFIVIKQAALIWQLLIYSLLNGSVMSMAIMSFVSLWRTSIKVFFFLKFLFHYMYLQKLGIVTSTVLIILTSYSFTS